MMDIKKRCKQEVSANGIYKFHQCSRAAVKDGYCNQHHPDTVKARQDEQMKKLLEKRAKDPLKLANSTIAQLEADKARLVEAIDNLKNVKGRHNTEIACNRLYELAAEIKAK
jgi:hypothetical protein